MITDAALRALLEDLPGYSFDAMEELEPDPCGPWLKRSDVLATLEAAPSPAAWQPIASAPPNTDILLVYTSGSDAQVVTVGAFIDYRWCSEHGRVTPHHWMPLPPAPLPGPDAQG